MKTVNKKNYSYIHNLLNIYHNILIWKRKIKRFHPTRLAIQLANGIENGYEINKEDKGFIIVETNYRIYAYTGRIFNQKTKLLCEKNKNFHIPCTVVKKFIKIK